MEEKPEWQRVQEWRGASGQDRAAPSLDESLTPEMGQFTGAELFWVSALFYMLQILIKLKCWWKNYTVSLYSVFLEPFTDIYYFLLFIQQVLLSAFYV